MQLTYKQVLVVEDNKYSMNRICSVLKEIENIIVIKAKNSGEAYKYAIEYDIDLFIIDIILEPQKEADLSGIIFADTIRKMNRYVLTPIIFTTALEDPKLHAFTNLHCYQYFEKPYDAEKLKEAVLTTLQTKRKKYEKEYVYFKIEKMVFPIKINEIVYIDNRITSLCIYCSNGEVTKAPYKSSRQLLLELNSNKFLKCNKSIIVNIDYIQSIDYCNSTILLKDNYGEVKIGRRMLKSFKESLLQC